jgi:hypothetical protein
MVRLLDGPSTVCRWNRRHRISHAPAMLLPLHPRAQHVFTRAWHTFACNRHTLVPRVSPRIHHVSTYRQSSCHVIMPRGRKKIKIKIKIKNKKRGKFWGGPTCGWHTPSATCLSTVSPRQHATWQKKKKKKEKFGEAERGSSTVHIHPQGLYSLASKLSFLNLLFMQFP